MTDTRSPIPDVLTSKGFRRLRFWIIRKLARKDSVIVNTHLALPAGWILACRHPSASFLFANNLLNLYHGGVPDPADIPYVYASNGDIGG